MKEYVTEEEKREFHAAIRQLRAGTRQEDPGLVEKSQREKEHPLPLFTIDGFIPPIEPNESILHRTSGVRDRMLKNMRNIKANAELDLHGCSLIEASAQLHTFLCDAYKMNYKMIRIIHGKGNKTGKAVLKSGVAYWLQQVPWVLAFKSATPNDGGTGALYVLLKQ